MTSSSFVSVALAPDAPAFPIPVNGELVRGSEAEVLKGLLPRVRRESVTLDLSGVERIDAAGIAALITLYCTAVESGNGFSVAAPSTRVLELLQLVGLDSILIADSGEKSADSTEWSGSARPACPCLAAA